MSDNTSLVKQYLDELKKYSDQFEKKGIHGIYTNSKMYEIIIAEYLHHKAINGYAGKPDAEDSEGNKYEYKHFKKSSSNHTWTFNDYSDKTIARLKEVKSVVFVEINDDSDIPFISMLFIVPSDKVRKLMLDKAKHLTNARRMMNISPSDLTGPLVNATPTRPTSAKLSSLTSNVFRTTAKLSSLIANDADNKPDLLTSNKLWEVLVAQKLGHSINSEQRKHDAEDTDGNTFEYKVYSRYAWCFQDISKAVLDSFLKDKYIVLAVVDKKNFSIKNIYACNPKPLVQLLKKKKRIRQSSGKEIRRLFETVGKRDLNELIRKGHAEIIL